MLEYLLVVHLLLHFLQFRLLKVDICVLLIQKRKTVLADLHVKSHLLWPQWQVFLYEYLVISWEEMEKG